MCNDNDVVCIGVYYRRVYSDLKKINEIRIGLDMAEYIERKALLELINEDCKYKNPTNEYTRGCNEVCDWAIKTIKNIPAADVVPKSEFEELKHKYELAVAEREANVKGFTEELTKCFNNSKRNIRSERD